MNRLTLLYPDPPVPDWEIWAPHTWAPWLSMRIFHALLFFLGAFLLDRMWRGLLRKIKVATLKRDPTHDADLERRLDTLGLMARRMGSVTLYVAAFLMTLADFDVQVGPLVAGLGIVGVAVGFGAQFLVRDLINGFFLVAEDQFRVGDSVKLDEFPGTVETITLRTTSLRALGGELHILPNGEIRAVTNYSRHWSRAVVDITVARTADLEAAFAALLAGAQSARRDEAVSGSFLEAPEIVGVTEISDTAVKIRLWAKVLPGQQWEVERAIRRAAADALSARGVALPVQRSEVALDRDSLSTLRERGEGP